MAGVRKWGPRARKSFFQKLLRRRGVLLGRIRSATGMGVEDCLGSRSGRAPRGYGGRLGAVVFRWDPGGDRVLGTAIRGAEGGGSEGVPEACARAAGGGRDGGWSRGCGVPWVPRLGQVRDWLREAQGRLAAGMTWRRGAGADGGSGGGAGGERGGGEGAEGLRALGRVARLNTDSVQWIRARGKLGRWPVAGGVCSAGSSRGEGGRGNGRRGRAGLRPSGGRVVRGSR